MRSRLPGKPGRINRKFFNACIQAYQTAGFGQFEISYLEWPIGRVQIRATNAFEAWLYRQKKNIPDTPICSYSAGVFVGFVNALADRQDVVCIEHTCEARGDEACFFELLPASQAGRKNGRSLHPRSRPGPPTQPAGNAL
ncbi:MAG: hypothetical protein IPJ90_11905 [Anaerolineaceae bacterium]|nr:hypothetical protein [Anaerolineaceae bacterium]